MKTTLLLFAFLGIFRGESIASERPNLLILIAILVLAAQTAPPAAAGAGAMKPNIVLLVADDAGPQLGCYGDRHASGNSSQRVPAKTSLNL